jgi:hypothetical protein
MLTASKCAATPCVRIAVSRTHRIHLVAAGGSEKPMIVPSGART